MLNDRLTVAGVARSRRAAVPRAPTTPRNLFTSLLKAIANLALSDRPRLGHAGLPAGCRCVFPDGLHYVRLHPPARYPAELLERYCYRARERSLKFAQVNAHLSGAPLFDLLFLLLRNLEL